MCPLLMMCHRSIERYVLAINNALSLSLIDHLLILARKGQRNGQCRTRVRTKSVNDISHGIINKPINTIAIIALMRSLSGPYRPVIAMRSVRGEVQCRGDGAWVSSRPHQKSWA